METIPQISHNPLLILSPPWYWFFLGITFCCIEYFLRPNISKNYRYVALMVGVSSILMAFILWRLEDKLQINWTYLMAVEGALTLQILFWIGLTFTFVFWVRPMFYRVTISTMTETTEAETLTEIIPGQMGRVLYEGSSWQACCEHCEMTIPPHQKVYVVGRKDNILFVIPEELFQL
jgi:membrane protein implicated in regulation of membrane protease activity